MHDVHEVRGGQLAVLEAFGVHQQGARRQQHLAQVFTVEGHHAESVRAGIGAVEVVQGPEHPRIDLVEVADDVRAREGIEQAAVVDEEAARDVGLDDGVDGAGGVDLGDAALAVRRQGGDDDDGHLQRQQHVDEFRDSAAGAAPQAGHQHKSIGARQTGAGGVDDGFAVDADGVGTKGGIATGAVGTVDADVHHGLGRKLDASLTARQPPQVALGGVEHQHGIAAPVPLDGHQAASLTKANGAQVE